MQYEDRRGKVPSTIYFDADLLFVPRFEEVGIPQDIGSLGKLTPEVTIGQWVNRGDIILKAHYSFYSAERKPRLPFFADHRWSIDESLISPVSGLVLDLQKEETSDQSEWGTVYYYEQNVLPVILVPKDEPPQDSWRLNFFQRIGSVLRENWRTCFFCHREKGHIRLGEIPELQQWQSAINRLVVIEHTAASY